MREFKNRIRKGIKRVKLLILIGNLFLYKKKTVSYYIYIYSLYVCSYIVNKLAAFINRLDRKNIFFFLKTATVKNRGPM